MSSLAIFWYHERQLPNHTGLWDADLTWYSQSATHRIYQDHEDDQPHWIVRCQTSLSCNNNKFFWLFHWHYSPLSELDYVAHSSVWLSNYPLSEAMYNVSANQLTLYYQSQSVPFKAWIVSVMWYTQHK